jgi:hypothetical protein
VAEYELRQMRDVLSRAAKLYPEAAATAQTLRLGEESGPILVAYGRLTVACNRCHQAAGVPFIAVQIPKRSPFSNQNFRPGKP